jgi:hypothetical protein
VRLEGPRRPPNHLGAASSRSTIFENPERVSNLVKKGAEFFVGNAIERVLFDFKLLRDERSNDLIHLSRRTRSITSAPYA